jgi:hypothetical protein
MTTPKLKPEFYQQAESALSVMSPLLDIINRALELQYEAEANEQQETYITADKARKRGLGNAEFFGKFSNQWILCDEFCSYRPDFKYRAIKQPEPVEPQQAAYPQPPKKEPVDPHVALRAEYAKQEEEGTTRFYLWEYRYSDSMTDFLPVADQVPLFDRNTKYRCTDISCYVSKDGEPAIRMLRTTAQAYQRSLGDTVDWFIPKGQKPSRFKDLSFCEKGIYTYRTKPAKVVAWEGSRDDVIALLKEVGLLK